MSEIRLVPMSAEQVERLRRLAQALSGQPPFWTPTTVDGELARSLAGAYEHGLTSVEGHGIADAAGEAVLIFSSEHTDMATIDKLRAVLDPEENRMSDQRKPLLRIGRWLAVYPSDRIRLRLNPKKGENR